MQPGKLEFRPGLWPSLATALLLPLLIGLGFWQLERAGQKEELERSYESRRDAPVVDLAASGNHRFDVEAMLWRRARLQGEYLAETQYLLDNQIMGGEPGYLVYTPFRLRDQDLVVLVNRGWIPLRGGRDQVPAVPAPEEESPEGMIKEPQTTGLVLEGAGMEQLGAALVRVQYLDPGAIGRRHDWRVLPYVVRLEGDSPDFVRDWRPPGFGRMRHIGYAFQWFAMAAAVLIIYLVLNTRRKRRNE